jgi:hypothetical protein
MTRAFVKGCRTRVEKVIVMQPFALFSRPKLDFNCDTIAYQYSWLLALIKRFCGHE